MIERYGQWIIRWRYFIILATLVLVALTTLGFPLKFDSDYRIFFREDNPQLIAFEELQNTYTKNDNVLFVLAPEDGKVFTNETLDAVEWLTHEAWQIPYSIRVDSITNFQYTYAEEDDLIVEDLITDAKTLSQENIERIKKIALQETQLINNLISPKADVTGINVTIQLPGEQQDKEVPEVVEFVRELADKIRHRYPDIKVYLTGIVVLNNAFPEASQQDLNSLLPIMFLVIIILLWLLLRILSGVVVTILLIVFSTVSAMGLAGLMGISLAGPATAAPVMILTLAIADSVHLLTTFRHEMWVNRRPKPEAIVESLRINFQPIFLTSLTTTIGFLSMNFGESPPFCDLGNIVAMGITVAFILSVSFLPALMAILPVRFSPQNLNKPGLFNKSGFSSSVAMDRLGEFVVQRRHGLLWGMAGIIVFFIAFLPRNELNDVFWEYYDESFDFRVASDFAAENLTGLTYIHYSLSAGEPEGISDPDFLGKIEEFARWYSEQPEVLHVKTIIDTLKRLNKNMHGDNPDYYRLPEQRDLVAQYLLLYEMSLPYGLDLNNQINVDKSATRMTVTLKNLSDNEVIALEERAQQWLKKNGLPTMQVPGTSGAIMFAHLNYLNIRGMLFGATIALVLISVILIVALRSIKFGLVSLIPNFVPAAMA
ncbi:MAG: RND transporter, partial [Candidatus Parabeggiatoa sp. nov. 1]